MPFVRDITNKTTKPVVKIICYRTFWRGRWRYYLQHDDGRKLSYSITYASIKELMLDVGTVRGRNGWAVHVTGVIKPTDKSEIDHQIERLRADLKIPPKK